MIPNLISDPSPHFDERTLPISMVVLHYTNMYVFNEALDILTGRNTEANGKVSAHYAISQNGKIYSLVPENKRAWHAGRSRFCSIEDVNSASIGVELDNPGDLYFKEHGAWPPYTKALLESLYSLLKDVCGRHHLNQHQIIGHCHVTPGRKTDPGPHFPWRDLWINLD